MKLYQMSWMIHSIWKLWMYNLKMKWRIIDSPCLEESILAKQEAKDELNAVFQLLNIEKIRDE